MEQRVLDVFWDLPEVQTVLGRVVDRALRHLHARMVLVVGGDHVVAEHGASERGRAYACRIAREVSALGGSLSVSRVPRNARPWLGPDSPTAYAAVPLRTPDGTIVGAVIALDVDVRAWDEPALEDLEETGSWIFAAAPAHPASPSPDVRDIAHGLNNLVSVISLAAEMAGADVTDREAFEDDLADILSAADRARRLTAELLQRRAPAGESGASGVHRVAVRVNRVA